MSVTYTPEQSAAIGARGKTVVSASAGSGKTFVMIEKLVSLILSEADIGDFLAVTFTNKAAAQMREKLKKALIAKIGDKSLTERERSSLKRKLALLPQADISTIHAFCGRLIRRYFYLLGVPADFEILGESAEGMTLANKAMDALFEEAYAAGEDDFFALLSVYRRKRSDRGVRDVISQLYTKIRPMANYREILSQARYDRAGFEAVLRGLTEIYVEKFRRRRQRAALLAEGILNMPRAQEFYDKIDFWMNRAIACPDYYELRSVCMASFPDKPRKRKDTSPAEAELFDSLGTIKNDLSKLAKEIAGTDEREEEYARYEEAGKIARALIRYTLRFDELYEAVKKERGKLDYNDLEHMTLRLLGEPDVLAELRAKYKYVFVDEYQDVNPVQEAIVSAVGGGEVFLVGDMKQSIYAFRGSKSAYFAHKMDEFSDEGNVLFLRNNFRSADAVLAFVNAIFSVSMREDTGVDYLSTSMMVGGGLYREGDGRVKLHVVPKRKEEGVLPEGVYSVEAHFRKNEAPPSPLAKALLRIVEEERNSRFYDLDRKEYRQVAYGDIAVLVRKSSPETEEAVRYLSERGIPVASSGKINICEYTEVAGLLDWLSLIDNAEQDIPLCSALLSAAGGFDEEELARIRVRFPKDEFRTACRRYCGLRDGLAARLEGFYAYLRELRAYAQVATAGEVLTKLVSERNLETEWLSYPNGKQKCKRVERLIAAANAPLCEFLSDLKASGGKIEYVQPAGENAVQVMTVHASKGLEFPVVILPALNQKFHGAEKDEVLFLDGVPAPYCYDAKRMVKEGTLMRKLCGERQKREEIRDELNLFYVALTRAKYALHLILSEVKPFDPEMVAEANCWADFFPADRFSPEEGVPDVLPFAERKAVDRGAPGDEKPILAAMDAVYPHPECVDLPVKSSASALLEEDEAYYYTPNAFGGDTETGTAYHKFLELADFSASAEEEYARLRPSFTEEEYARLELPRLKQILSMPVFRRLQGKKLCREQRFLCFLPASLAFDTESDEPVLFQGAIDLLVLNEKDAEIVDYKYSGKTDEALLSHYGAQLRLYRAAVSRIAGIPPERIRMTLVNIRSASELTVSDK